MFLSVITPEINTGQATILKATPMGNETESVFLSVTWGLVDEAGNITHSANFSNLERRTTTFASFSPGSYTIGCIAYDGELSGEPGIGTVTVVAPYENKGPVDFSLTPLTAIVEPGETVSLLASASDPEDDPLTFSWMPTTHLTGLSSTSSASQVIFSTEVPGIYMVTVSVTDGNHTSQIRSSTIVVQKAEIDIGDGIDNESDNCPIAKTRIVVPIRVVCNYLILFYI
jgi:hypothetical protein